MAVIVFTMDHPGSATGRHAAPVQIRTGKRDIPGSFQRLPPLPAAFAFQLTLPWSGVQAHPHGRHQRTAHAQGAARTTVILKRPIGPQFALPLTDG